MEKRKPHVFSFYPSTAFCSRTNSSFAVKFLRSFSANLQWLFQISVLITFSLRSRFLSGRNSHVSSFEPWTSSYSASSFSFCSKLFCVHYLHSSWIFPDFFSSVLSSEDILTCTSSFCLCFSSCFSATPFFYGNFFLAFIISNSSRTFQISSLIKFSLWKKSSVSFFDPQASSFFSTFSTGLFFLFLLRWPLSFSLTFMLLIPNRRWAATHEWLASRYTQVGIHHARLKT